VVLVLEAAALAGSLPRVKVLPEGVVMVTGLVEGLPLVAASELLRVVSELGGVESATYGYKRCWVWLSDRAPRYALAVCGALVDDERQALEAYGVHVAWRARHVWSLGQWWIECASLRDLAFVARWLRFRGHAFGVVCEAEGLVPLEVSSVLPVRDALGAAFVDDATKAEARLVALLSEGARRDWYSSARGEWVIL
jgi:hypothetical protein